MAGERRAAPKVAAKKSVAKGPVTKAAVTKAAATKGARARDASRETRDASLLYERLQQAYPDARCELDFRTPFELLVATILSAQCTDRRVNLTTPALFDEFPDAPAMAAAPVERVEALVKSTGFFRQKAKNIVAMAQALVAEHGGLVPADMAALRRLPGVGRKTANVILGTAYGMNEGVTVDTHVARLSARLALTRHDDAERIERDLMPLFPREQWAMLSHLLIFHGRRCCDARRPKCGACPVAELCPSRADDRR